MNNFVLVLSVFGFALSVSSELHRRFEYQFSFKGPHLSQRDGTIPFWRYGGDAIASDESVRVTPSLKSKKGWVWTKNQTSFKQFDVEMSVRISGRGRVGADGLALWFTEEASASGPVFGSGDKWKGLGIFLDSFDNDGQQNNPYIMAMLNDGTKEYDHVSDGLEQQLGGCLRDFRNKPYPFRLRIHYAENNLYIFVHNGLSPSIQWETCVQANNVNMPEAFYIGVTAATGGLADDHDVQSLITHSLHSLSDQGQDGFVPDAEKQKYEKEFEDYKSKLDSAKEEYRKVHPTAAGGRHEGTDDLDEDDYWEDKEAQQLKQILQAHQVLQFGMKEVNTKLDQVLGRQASLVASVSDLTNSVRSGAGAPGGAGQLPPAAGRGVETGGGVRREEVAQILQSQRDLSLNIQTMKTILDDMYNKQITGGSGSRGGAGVGNAMADSLALHEIKDNFNGVKNDIQQLLVKSKERCPSPAAPSSGFNYDSDSSSTASCSCLSKSFFITTTSVILVLFIAYAVYSDRQNQRQKKFY